MVDFSCHKCNKKFKSQYHLDRHLNRKNSCDKSNNFICDICKKEFTLKFNYERHKKRKIPCVQNSNGESSQSENQIKLEIEKEKTERIKIEASIELEKLKLKAELDLQIEREKSRIRIEEERERTKEKIKLKQVEEKKTLYIKCENDVELLVNKIRNNTFFDSINSIDNLAPPTNKQVMDLILIKNKNEAYYTILESVYIKNEKNRCIIPIIHESSIKFIIKKNNSWIVKEYNDNIPLNIFREIRSKAEDLFLEVVDELDKDKEIKIEQPILEIIQNGKRIDDKDFFPSFKFNTQYSIKNIIEHDYLLNLM